MTLDEFVFDNREKLIGAIHQIRNHWRLTPIKPTPAYTHRDLIQWVLNDNELYQLALSCGVEGI